HRTFSGLPGTSRPLTDGPLVHCVPHLLVACELSSIRLRHSLSDLLDLPLVYGDVLTDGFGSNERAAAALRLGQTVKAFPHLRLQPQRHYPVFRHEYPPNTKEHCVFKQGSATTSETRRANTALRVPHGKNSYFVTGGDIVHVIAVSLSGSRRVSDTGIAYT